MGLYERVFEAGVVGCGGAGFPTHAKLRTDVSRLLVNGAECEPLLYADKYLLRHFASEIVFAAAAVSSELGASECAVAMKSEYRAEMEAVKAAVSRTGASVSIGSLQSFYPAGDEHVLVFELTGHAPPPGGLPSDVGCLVMNVSTLLAVYDALAGRTFTHRYFSVAGEVERPSVLRAPIGAPLSFCLEAAGGAKPGGTCAILGGPMMGRVISIAELESQVVTKTLSGLVILPGGSPVERRGALSARQVASRARAGCIRCSQCGDLCPRSLLGHPIEPHQIMRRLAFCGDLDALDMDDPVIRGATLCSECGVCEIVACPMGLNPRRVNGEIKARLARAGLRYEHGGARQAPHPFREFRKTPSARAAARAGVYKYYGRGGTDILTEVKPPSVRMPLLQHRGAPSEPVVPDGAFVEEGSLVARCPEGKLGANLCASISGVVEIRSDHIVITARS
jgi:Na+-translocating ferredoxin:NAD+ oxidoreductase RnfC subunit